jgi:hypothetical protein
VSATVGNRFRPGLEQFEAREVPAAFTFAVPGGTGTATFTDPSEVDPTQAVQSIPVPDLAVAVQGADSATVDAVLTPVATYNNGVLVGVLASLDVTTGGIAQEFLLSGGAATAVVDSRISTTADVLDPHVTIDLTNQTPVSQLAITIRLDNDVVRTVIVNLTGPNWAGGIQGVMLNVQNALRAAGFEVSVVGGVLTIWGNRAGTAQVVSVGVAVTGMFPVVGGVNLPVVDGQNGATATAIFNTPKAPQ